MREEIISADNLTKDLFYEVMDIIYNDGTTLFDSDADAAWKNVRRNNRPGSSFRYNPNEMSWSWNSTYLHHVTLTARAFVDKYTNDILEFEL